VSAFIQSHPHFAAEDLSALYPAYAHPRDGRFLQLLPHRHDTDGFFIARLRRTG
jgi:16S rRNA C967 or C1407 C5-methylase (RsmB/RsmF family)